MKFFTENKTGRRFALIALVVVSGFNLTAQSLVLAANHGQKPSGLLQKESRATNTTLRVALETIQKKYHISVFYNPDEVDNRNVEFFEDEPTLERTLEKLLKPINLVFEKVDSRLVIVRKPKLINTAKQGYGNAPPQYQGNNYVETQSISILKVPLSVSKSAAANTVKLSRNITGIIKDGESGDLIPGANIVVKEVPNLGTVTDGNGAFTLLLPDGAKTLIVSSVGFKRKEVTLGASNEISIALDLDEKILGEVVVVGYGEQKREDLTGAISSIKTSELQNLPQVSVDQLMQGKASGVVVTNNSGQPGSSASVRIRGITSLNGNNEPLYVIDGIPVSGDGQNTSTSNKGATEGFAWAGGGNGQTALSPLSALNPSDILSIDILKDASATAIYGSRASNGVVIITTKRGNVNDGKISYDAYYGIQTPSRFLNVLPLNEFAKFQNEMAASFNTNPREEFQDPSILRKGVDWQRELMKNAGMMSHQIGIAGGKEKMQYYISAGYMDQDGIVVGSGFNRYSVRLNLDNQVKKWFKVGSSFTASRTKERITLNDDAEGVIAGSVTQSPDIPVRNLDGSFGGPVIDNAAIVPINPVAKALLIDNMVTRSRIMGNLYSDINIGRNLVFRTELGGDFTFGKNDQFRPTYQWGRINNPTASALKSNNSNQYWILKNYITYKTSFAEKHNITVMAGHEVQEARWNGTTATRQNFITNDVKELGVGDKNGQTGDSYSGALALESYFGRAVYSFNNRYSVTGTLRADGSSKFQQGKKWGVFPSLAAAWTLSNEPFMKSLPMLSNLKLRIGYGEVGNQDIPGYRYNPTLSSALTGFGTGYRVDYTANPNLKWESATQSNIGLDFGFGQGRVDVSIDIYRKISKDFLYPLPIPAILGSQGTGAIGAPYVNLGEMKNEGIDFSINSRNITGKFIWTTGLNISTYRNKVIDIQGLAADGRVQFNFFTVTKTIAGQPIGQFYGYKTVGIFKDKADLDASPRQFGKKVGEVGNSLGDIKFADINNDGVINTKDLTFIGTPHPDFTYGMTNTFSFMGVDLSVFLQGSQGSTIFNFTRRSTEGMDKLFTNQLSTVLNRWTPENPNSDMPRAVAGSDNPNLAISDRFLEDGSYLRIQNISLGYTLPTKLLSRLKVSRLRLYTTIQNLANFTKYTGYDPEIGAYNQKALLMNIDNGRYPMPRTYTFGLNLEF